jgi:hypothetical protein
VKYLFCCCLSLVVVEKYLHNWWLVFFFIVNFGRGGRPEGDEGDTTLFPSDTHHLTQVVARAGK